VTSDPSINSVNQALETRWGLDALWVFGSRALGTARFDSDLDVAALFRVRPAVEELFAFRGELDVISTEGYGLPDSVAGSFSLLEMHGVIGSDLASRLRKMVGFRNIAVHDYQTIDPRIVGAIVAGPVEDLRVFAAAVLSYFGIV
jgi:hypothetical protein